MRSWRTLFAHLPPPQELYEAALEQNLLKTAGGYLLVLHNFNDLESSSKQCVRLLERAKDVEDWELCKELARFLMALDASGDTLREALVKIGLTPMASRNGSTENVRLNTPQPNQAGSMKQHKLNGTMNGGLDSKSPPSSPRSDSPRIQTITAEEGVASDEENYFSPRTPMAK